MCDLQYDQLLERNREWVGSRTTGDPDFFPRLCEGQRPRFLLIGCSDSRQPLNTITQTDLGDLFIHRNVGNQVRPDDLNVQAVLEFAVGILEVHHIIVCGHSRCGGIDAAARGVADGAVGEWIRPIRELLAKHADELEAAVDPTTRLDRLGEMNVVVQVENLLRAPPVCERRVRGSAPRVHGWICRLESGLIEEVALPEERWRGEGLLARGDLAARVGPPGSSDVLEAMDRTRRK